MFTNDQSRLTPHDKWDTLHVSLFLLFLHSLRNKYFLRRKIKQHYTYTCRRANERQQSTTRKDNEKERKKKKKNFPLVRERTRRARQRFRRLSVRWVENRACIINGALCRNSRISEQERRKSERRRAREGERKGERSGGGMEEGREQTDRPGERVSLV